MNRLLFPGARCARARRTVVRGERAQGLLEFAIIAPCLVLIFLGVVDYSRFLYYNQTIVSAARAGGDMAINHCSIHASCGMTDTPIGDEFVIQSVYCDASPSVHLSPQPSTCSSCLTTNCTASSICGASCLSGLCTQDICTSPTASSRLNGEDVTVYVGYRWAPLTPLISGFFPTKSCWPSDPLSNHHTLCASATGNVY